MFEISFQYDKPNQKWKVIAKGAISPLEALQGFNAVLITCKQATPTIESNDARLCKNGTYEISVGI